MSRRNKIAVLAMVAFGFASCCHAGEKTKQPRHIVLISVDGLSATYFDDPKASLPTLRRLAARGAHAQGMITTFPSVTWPAHVSLITGASPARHGVIGNSVLNRKTQKQITYIGDPVFTKDECVRVPTLYDAVHAAGLKTASIIWPACNGAKTLDWVIPDSNQQRIHDRYTTPGLLQELAKADISISKLGQWGWAHKYSAMRDDVYTRAAIHLLHRHRPNLLIMHLITPDGFEHDYGPDVEETYWACGNADDRIEEIWRALQQPPINGNAALFVVSDHGFAPYTKFSQPNVLLRRLGLIEADSKGKIVSRKAWSHSSGGSAVIYLFDDENKQQLIKKLKPLLAELPGVDKVLDAAEFAKYGQPNSSDNPQQGDLMLSAKSGYAFSNSHTSPDLVAPVSQRRGAHGHLPNQRFMHATFVTAGAGIKPGVKLKEISSLDVAPTIARMLEVELPTAEGRVLEEILTTSK